MPVYKQFMNSGYKRYKKYTKYFVNFPCHSFYATTQASRKLDQLRSTHNLSCLALGGWSRIGSLSQYGWFDSVVLLTNEQSRSMI